ASSGASTKVNGTGAGGTAATYPAGRRSQPRSVVSPNFDLGRRFITKDFVVDRHRLEGPLVSGSGLRSRLASRLHLPDHPFGVVWATLPVKDDLVQLHVSALDGELHVLDVLLDPFPLFGSDPHAWI